MKNLNQTKGGRDVFYQDALKKMTIFTNQYWCYLKRFHYVHGTLLDNPHVTWHLKHNICICHLITPASAHQGSTFAYPLSQGGTSTSMVGPTWCFKLFFRLLPSLSEYFGLLYSMGVSWWTSFKKALQNQHVNFNTI